MQRNNSTKYTAKMVTDVQTKEKKRTQGRTEHKISNKNNISYPIFPVYLLPYKR